MVRRNEGGLVLSVVTDWLLKVDDFTNVYEDGRLFLLYLLRGNVLPLISQNHVSPAPQFLLDLSLSSHWFISCVGPAVPDLRVEVVRPRETECPGVDILF